MKKKMPVHDRHHDSYRPKIIELTYFERIPPSSNAQCKTYVLLHGCLQMYLT